MSELLKMENLTFTFDKDVILDIEQIIFPAEKITAVTGANGSGKTTLLRIIAGLITPQTGIIYYKGSSVPGRVRDFLKKQSVLVHQKPYLFSGTVRKNIKMGMYTSGITGKDAEYETDELLEKFTLSGLGNKKVSCLSGGERQKVALARAAGLHRPVLLLDEPEVHIDNESREAIENLLAQLAEEGKHIIFSTHDSEFARRLSGQIIRLHSGKIEGVEII